MKRIFLLTVILATTLGTSQEFARAENRLGDQFILPTSTHMFEDVPLGHWSYSALHKVLSQYEPQFKIRPIQRPLSRYDFATMTFRYEDRAGAESNSPEVRDLFVSLKYEYGMDIIGVLTLGKAGFDGYYSDANKKKFVKFSQVARKKHDILTPDQWSDFLDEAQRLPLFAGR